MKDLGAITRYLTWNFTKPLPRCSLTKAPTTRSYSRNSTCNHASQHPLHSGFITQCNTKTPEVCLTQYCQAVGKLLYLTNTHLDLSMQLA